MLRVMMLEGKNKNAYMNESWKSIEMYARMKEQRRAIRIELGREVGNWLDQNI